MVRVMSKETKNMGLKVFRVPIVGRMVKVLGKDQEVLEKGLAVQMGKK